MTKLIAVLIILVILYCGYQLFEYWQNFKSPDDTAKQNPPAEVIQPESLPGLPQSLEASLKTAHQQGAAAMKNWLRVYGAQVQDPRKAWIELDYCEAVFRADPSEARRVFAAVKLRTPPSSPVWPRVNQLEKSYE